VTNIKSTFADVPLSDLTITQRVFQGMGDDPNRVTLIDGPSGREIVVIGAPDATAGEVPMAFIVSGSENAATLEDVQGFLDGKLAHYKQVRRIETVSEIPKSALGKILRRVLRAQLNA